MFTDLRPEKLIKSDRGAVGMTQHFIKAINAECRDDDGNLDPRDVLGALALTTAWLLAQCYYEDERRPAAYTWWQVVLQQTAALEKANRA